MLKELYDYAVANQLAVQPGYKPKNIRAYVCLGKHGEFLGIDPGPEEPVVCPDMGTAAQGTEKCNVPVEKRNIPLSNERPLKKAFFLGALEDASREEPRMAVLHNALRQEELVDQINRGLDEQKIKPVDRIGFKVDGTPLETLAGDWWLQFRAAQIVEKKGKGTPQRCLITGQLTEPVATAGKVSGLRSVGGRSEDVFICCDKQAFCSYGFKKAENACVSKEAMSAVNAALTQLIQKAPSLAGAKWIHWYEKPVPREEDCFEELFGPAAEEAEGKEDSPGKERTDRTQAAMANTQAKRLVESYRTGERTGGLENTYSLLSLSGADGRVLVRSWQQGSYAELQAAMDAWWEDLSLISPDGKSLLKPPAIGKLNFRLLKPQQGGKSIHERMKQELAGVEPMLISAIINHHPLPDVVASKALEYIRSKMLDTGEDHHSREPIPDPVSCQLLKAWLIRKKKEIKGGIIMQTTCNPDIPDVAYQCGRMMAVYAAIQSRAMGRNVGAGVIQRYYTGASTNPALVFAQLSQLASHHLEKIESKGAVIYYENLLGEIAEKIGCRFPQAFSLPQRADFSLGYYQQRAAMFEKNTAAGQNSQENEGGEQSC